MSGMSKTSRTVGFMIYAAALLAAQPSASALPLVDVDIGVKGGVHGAYLAVESQFDNSWARTLFEDDDAFGVGGSGGLYTQVRFLDWLGLELDLLISKDQTTRSEKYTIAPEAYVKLEHTDWAWDMRVPVIAKLFWGLGPVSLSMGLGAEYVTPLDNGHEVEQGETVNATVDQAQFDAFRDAMKSVSKDSLFLLGQLELAIELGVLTIPVDLRVGRNLWQSDRFEDRFDYTYEQRGNQIEVTGANIACIYSWDFRLLTGVAMSF